MTKQSIVPLALMATCALCGAQLLTNGGFEIPIIPTGTGKHVDELGSAFVGWTIGGSGGMAELVNSQIPAAGLDFNPVEGNQHLAFNGGDSPAGRWIAQTFDTTVGGEYALSFKVARIGISNAAVSITAAVLSDSAQVLANLAATPPAHGYGAEQRLLFTATSSKTTVRFLDTSAATIAVDVLLDAVNLETIFQYGFQFTAEKIWDFSGTVFDDDMPGNSVTLNHAPQGIITGYRTEAITNETLNMAGTMQVSGAVKSTPKGVRLKYDYRWNLSGTDEGQAATISGPAHITYFLSGRILEGTVLALACLNSATERRCVSIRDSEMERLDLDEEMTGAWTLALNVNESGRILSGNAVARMSNGREVPFALTGNRARSGTGTLTLRGTGDATGVTLRVKVDQSMNLKSVRGRIFGQVVRVLR